MGLELELQQQIERKYLARGDRLGWRLLYSPAAVLDGSEVAFIGLNPGGNTVEPDHPSFACVPGASAYVNESWKSRPPGEEALQKQVRALFQMLGVAPENVLAGNLVPFRSPDWASLPDQPDALRFGRDLWRTILAGARPRLVVAMGRLAADHVAEIIGVQQQAIGIGWGRLTATRGQVGDVRFVALPHLSRFRLLGREQSREGLEALFLGTRPYLA